MEKAAATLLASATLLGGGAVIDRNTNPFTDRGDHYEVKGQSVIDHGGEVRAELARNRPAVTLSKWSGESPLTIGYDKVHGQGSRPLFTDRMEWKGDTEEVHAYPLDATEQMEDGGFEIEVVLPAQPDTNVFNFQVEGWEQYDFFYQPALTAELKGEVCSDTLCQVNGETTRERPENVVGSYAVYHKTLQGAAAGKINYTTGKAFHIFRPKAIDADGNEVWAELSYADGTLTVTVPTEFLSTATYPVRVDPTFGYTSQGASDQTLGGGSTANPVYGKFTLSEAADMTQISSFLKYLVFGHNAQMGVYDDDGASALPSTQLAVSGDFFVSDVSYVQYDMPISTTGTPAGDYWLCAATAAVGFGSVAIAYDSGGEMAVNTDNDVCPSPASIGSSGSTNKLSIFVTYTASGGGGGGGGGAASGTIFFE